jgi:hypothetical protein
MPLANIPIVGPTYTSRSLPVSSQLTVNMYLEADQNAGTPISLQSFWGLKSFGATGAGVDRGMHVHNGVLYKVTGTNLYSLSSLGAQTLIGTISGTNRCSLASDGTNLVIANGSSKPYTWDGTTLTQGTDIDLPNSNTVAYINNRVVYDGGGSNRDVAFADLTVPLSVNSLNVTSSNQTPDNVIAVYTKLNQLFVCGDDAIRPYYNSGTGNPPYDVIQNSVQDVGLKAVHSLASNVNYVYFLGSDLNVYRISQYQAIPIGNPAIGQAIKGYTGQSDAIGQCFTLDDQNFYLISFGSQASWLFNEVSQSWTNLSFLNGVTNESSLISSYAYAYNKHLVADRRNGNVYELDPDTYTDNGSPIKRQRDTVSIDGRNFGAPGREIFMDRFQVIVEMGVGTVADPNPVITLQTSDDSGRSWSSERLASIGAAGDYVRIAEWFNLGSFRSRLFRIQCSSAVRLSIVSANADVEIGIE